ncbi:putative methylesterase 11, chloroplastic [Cornus florida]|uniref:putative methylesterase 11, chloroplastic n=1 Tax=Cornus florida TaxID=4283 RepID=UPI00289FF8BB|nr:putative methylesterase 11, chloroplastic [Cornus florida]
MGNSIACFSSHRSKQKAFKSSGNPPMMRDYSTGHKSSGRVFTSSTNNTIMDDSLIREQAVTAAALLFHHQNQQQQSGYLLPFDRSTSVQYPPLPSSKKPKKCARSSSSRPRSNSDSLPQLHQLIAQDLNIDDLETKHFVLVHGGGFGAWCWYKNIALLQESGFEVDAVDLTGSGTHSYDTNNITSFAQYVKPLTDFLEKLQDGKKVILVGHDLGGACVSYAMELHPFKVSKAIFVAAAMLPSGQSILSMFSQQAGSNDLMQRAQTFLYGNGKDQPPTAIELDKELLKDLLFNQSPAKDVALASVSMRPIPFAPVTKKLSLSKAKYGSVQRFYIKSEEDFAIPVSLQEAMISSDPPKYVFELKGSDHSPFFSRPRALHRLLVEISKTP